MVNVFVYGSLMNTYWNHHYLSNCEFIGTGLLEGFEMYHVSSFPGIIVKPGEIVLGEVYSVDPRTLKTLDRLESEGSMYIRREEIIKIEEDTINAFVYVWNGDIRPGCKKVEKMPWRPREG